MSVKITPAVLGTSRKVFLHRLRLATQLHPSQIHIDIMDGSFVSSRSVGREVIAKINSKIPLTFHLMVRHPERWLTAICQAGGKEVILPVELGQRLHIVIPLFRAFKIRVWLAISPNTRLSALRPWAGVPDGLVVMGVRPGRYHAPFIPATLRRIQQLRRHNRRLSLAVDGGVSPATLPLIVRAGASSVMVGSFVLLADRPQVAWKTLHHLVPGPKK